MEQDPDGESNSNFTSFFGLSTNLCFYRANCDDAKKEDRELDDLENGAEEDLTKVSSQR